MMDREKASGSRAAIDGIPFDSCLCLGFRKGARQTTRIYDEYLAPAGLRITQFGLLAHLEGRGIPIALTELAAELRMDPTTLNRNLKPLEREKLLRIIDGRKDRRVREISITTRGRRLLWQAAPLWKAAHQHVYRVLGLADAARLAELMNVSLQRLDATEVQSRDK